MNHEERRDIHCACFNIEECHPDCPHQKSCYGHPKVETVEQELFSVNDVLSVKTALMKYGYGGFPESNDLSNVQIVRMFRRLAEVVRRGFYEQLPKDHTKPEE